MNQAQAAFGEPAVRTSDTERDQAAEVLRVAYAEGRLTRGELDERIGVAYAATTPRGPVRPDQRPARRDPGTAGTPQAGHYGSARRGRGSRHGNRHAS